MHRHLERINGGALGGKWLRLTRIELPEKWIKIVDGMGTGQGRHAYVGQIFDGGQVDVEIGTLLLVVHHMSTEWGTNPLYLQIVLADGDGHIVIDLADDNEGDYNLDFRDTVAAYLAATPAARCRMVREQFGPPNPARRAQLEAKRAQLEAEREELVPGDLKAEVQADMQAVMIRGAIEDLWKQQVVHDAVAQSLALLAGARDWYEEDIPVEDMPF